MKDRQLHPHPSNSECDAIDCRELELGDRLQDGDLYPWGRYWWSTQFPGRVVQHDDPTFIRPVMPKP